MSNWNLEDFAKFWTNIEYEIAEQLKFEQFYDADSCLGDQTCCDHDCDNCQVGEEEEFDEERFNEEEDFLP